MNYKHLNKIFTDRQILNEYVELCGVNSSKIGDYITDGLQHYVFNFRENDDFVIKVPKFDLMSRLYGTTDPAEAIKDLELIMHYFEDYVIPTKIFTDKSKKYYAVIQPKLKNFRYLTSTNIHEVIGQFHDIHKRNKQMEKDYKRSLDYCGKSGILKSLNISAQKATIFIFMTNLVLDDDTKTIQIMDTNLYDLDISPFKLSKILTDRVLAGVADSVFRKAKFIPS